MNEPIQFEAYLAGTNTQSKWLAVGNDGDGKMVLEFSADQLGQILRLATHGKTLLKVTVEVEQ